MSSQLYNIKRILRSKAIKNSRMYLVQWEGYPIEDATWEPKESIQHTQPFIDYKRTQKRRKREHQLNEKSENSENQDTTPTKKVYEPAPTHKDSKEQAEDYTLNLVLGHIFLKGKKYYFIDSLHHSRGKQVLLADGDYIIDKNPKVLAEYYKKILV